MTIPDDIRCLSIRQPWAWLICAGYKAVENRTWQTHYRGPVLIHACSAWADDALLWKMAAERSEQLGASWPTKCECYRGGIVGVATLVDVVTEHPSPFFTGPCGWVLEDARPLPFVPCKGRLGLWRPGAELLAQVREAAGASLADLSTPGGAEQGQSDG